MSDAGNGRERLLFSGIIDARAAEHPDKVFMWIDDRPWTYAEFRDGVRRTAVALEHLGVRPGGVVATLGRTSFTALCLQFATCRVGGLFMPINTDYKGEYLRHQLTDAQADLMVVDHDLLDRVEDLLPQLPQLHTVLVTNPADAGEVTEHQIGPATVRSAALLLAETDAEPQAVPTPWNEPAFVFYTSGTTGMSKGVLLTQHNLITCAGYFNRNFGIREDDIQYSASPLFHMSGAYTSVVTVLVGGRTGILDTRFSVTKCWDRIRDLNATVFFGVGAMVLMLWNKPPADDDADLPVRLMITAPIPVDLWHPIEQRYGCEIVTGYGQTEVPMLTQMVAGEDNVPGSAGRPMEIFDVRIVDDDDEDVPVGEPGEIVFRPRQPHVMFEGYMGRPAAMLAQLRNLWFHTGDVGRFDERGNMFFIDRKKDALRRRGENISSFEVERIVLGHVSVAECAAFAVPSALGEDEVMIAVVPAESGQFDFDALAAYCDRELPRFARPRYVQVLDALPKSVTGRVQKHVLREAGVGQHTWDFEAAAAKPEPVRS